MDEERFLVGDHQSSLITLMDVPGMTFVVEPYRDYTFRFIVPFKTAIQTNGVALAVKGPDDSIYIAYASDIPVGSLDSASQMYHGSGLASDDIVLGSGASPTGAVLVARLTGILRNGVSPGELKLRFASETLGQNVVVLEGAHGILTPHPTP